MEERRVIRRLDGPSRRVAKAPHHGPAQPPSDSASSQPPQAQSSTMATGDTNSSLADSYVEKLAEPRKRRRRRFNISWSRKKTALAVALVLVGVVVAVGIKAVMASQRIVTKNSGGGAPALAGEVDPTKLKGEGDGRINVLLLGIGGDNHDGGNLSDTIMVASIDPVNKTVAMLSIPRDLYVRIPGYGYSKINAANSYGGPDLAKQVVSRILDLPIHYYVQVDFSGFKQAVDAVGGVDVKNDTRLYDPEYPCDNGRGYCTFNLPAGQYHMDGTLALKFARCRHGLCGNDFGRAARQQLLMVALRQKALQASTLTNPVKVNGLIDSVGDHVRTDFQIKELQKMAKIVKDLDVSKATNKVLDNSDTGLLISGDSHFPGAGSILLPKAGDFDYSEIQELAHSIFIDGYLKKENATVAIQNGTLRSGLGAAVSKQLKAYSYNIVDVSTAPEQTHETSTVIDYSGGKKPYTIRYLETRFNTKAISKPHPVDANGKPTGPDIVIIVGNDYKLSSTASVTP